MLGLDKNDRRFLNFPRRRDGEKLEFLFLISIVYSGCIEKSNALQNIISTVFEHVASTLHSKVVYSYDYHIKSISNNGIGRCRFQVHAGRCDFV